MSNWRFFANSMKKTDGYKSMILNEPDLRNIRESLFTVRGCSDFVIYSPYMYKTTNPGSKPITTDLGFILTKGIEVVRKEFTEMTLSSRYAAFAYNMYNESLICNIYDTLDAANYESFVLYYDRKEFLCFRKEFWWGGYYSSFSYPMLTLSPGGVLSFCIITSYTRSKSLILTSHKIEGGITEVTTKLKNPYFMNAVGGLAETVVRTMYEIPPKHAEESQYDMLCNFMKEWKL